MWKCTYIETSAKNNYNIEAIFQEILELEQKRQLELHVEEEKVNFTFYLLFFCNLSTSLFFFMKYCFSCRIRRKRKFAQFSE